MGAIDRQTVVPAMTLPRPAELPDSGGRGLSGVWCELTGPAGEVLYRSLVSRRLFAPVEVFEADGTMSRPGPLPTDVVVDLLLPVVDGGDELRVLAAGEAARRLLPPGMPEPGAGGVAELARLPLPPVGRGRVDAAVEEGGGDGSL